MKNLILEIPRVYTALAEWSASLIYISILPKKFRLKKIILISLFILFFQSSFLVYTKKLPIFFWLPCMIAAIIIMFAFIYYTTKTTFKDAAYYSVRAFILAELIASLERQFYWFIWPQNNASDYTKILFFSLIYILILYLSWKLEKRYLQEDFQLNVNNWELIGAISIGSAVFFISNISFIFSNTPFSGQYPQEIIKIRTLVDIGGYAILYAHFIHCCERREKQEVEALSNVLNNQYIQYKNSRNSIDLINQKYHDLKYQINILRQDLDNNKKKKWLDSLENEIEIYEAQNNTGNSVLDTILTSKNIICQKNNIQFTRVINGKLLSFMEIRDICSIFGNALDNAIESSKKIKNHDKRIIHTTLSQKRGFIILKFENYYQNKLNFKKGLPLTTKNNNDFHGYGLKSISHTSKKYGGSTKIYTKDNWFELNILFPIDEINI
ncbi:ATP-binding protein [Halanaerobium praevalens]|uniref:Histidine kinase n=1 Tax=Halanaerobium praevalens (strain ATCC 33744 / DSM 2228 / GSL) TaxID=572479 RepID=E3DM00_HALPG|nr:ATP-binding protein [Halanaerobium praevalens]ADO76259.1 histidine kinase [Halanaerobium praevalens DSM 2228]